MRKAKEDKKSDRIKVDKLLKKTIPNAKLRIFLSLLEEPLQTR